MNRLLWWLVYFFMFDVLLLFALLASFFIFTAPTHLGWSWDVWILPDFECFINLAFPVLSRKIPRALIMSVNVYWFINLFLGYFLFLSNCLLVWVTLALVISIDLGSEYAAAHTLKPVWWNKYKIVLTMNCLNRTRN